MVEAQCAHQIHGSAQGLGVHAPTPPHRVRELVGDTTTKHDVLSPIHHKIVVARPTQNSDTCDLPHFPKYPSHTILGQGYSDRTHFGVAKHDR